jgi:ketosteroid isomerase-like protein
VNPGTTRRHQGFHDLVFGTTVEIRNPALATPYDYVEARAPDPTRVPAPLWRRILVILVYSLAGFIGYVLVNVTTLSKECVIDGRCSSGEHAWGTFMVVAWMAAQAACIVLGWNGRLPGSRGRRVSVVPAALALGLGLTLSPGASAQSRPDGGAVDSVTARMTEYDRAWNRRDTVTVARLLSPDYQYFTSRGGVQSRAQVMGMVGSPAYVLKRAKRTELAVRIVDPVAVVSSRWEGEGTYRGKPFVDDQRCGLVWLRSGRSWQVVSEHCVQIVPRPAPSN